MKKSPIIAGSMLLATSSLVFGASGLAWAEDTNPPATDSTPVVSTPADPSVKTIVQLREEPPAADTKVHVSGIVTAVQSGRGGFIIQMKTADVPKDTKVSSAIFVHTADLSRVKRGDLVELKDATVETEPTLALKVDTAGITVSEKDKLGEIQIPTEKLSNDPAVMASKDLMLINPAGDYYVTGNDQVVVTGQLTLVDENRPALQPTQVGEPGSKEALVQAEYNKKHMLVLDDGNSAYFDSVRGKKVTVTPPESLPYLSLTKPGPTLGAKVTFNQPIVPVVEGKSVVFDPVETVDANQNVVTFSDVREGAPANVGGNFKLATFNVLNYFSDLGKDAKDKDKDGKPLCYPEMALYDKNVAAGGNWDCPRRGAWDEAGLHRQQVKIVKAINSLGKAGAQVVALQEIENGIIFGDDWDVALKHLVKALNAADPTLGWEYVPAPKKLPEYGNKDMIRQAFIYRPALVELKGAEFFVDDPAFQSAADARASVAQKFVHKETGATVLVINNHLTYKGGKVVGDDNKNLADGKDKSVADAWDTGRNNGDRTRQAEAIAKFVNKHSHDCDMTVLVGDFNAYAGESPIQTLVKAGFNDLMNTAKFPSKHSKTAWNEYSYNYRSTFGSLDHVMISNDGLKLLAGMDIWTANAYESKAYEYSRYKFTGTDYYNPEDVFRASDHNSAIVGFNLPKKQVTPPAAVDPSQEKQPVQKEEKEGDNNNNKQLAATGSVAESVLLVTFAMTVAGGTIVALRRRYLA